MTALRYTVRYEHPHLHLLSFELLVPPTHTPSFTLRMPLWRPGRYTRQNYPQYVYPLKAYDAAGNALAVQKTDSHTWEVTAHPEEPTRICYDYYAGQMDAGGVWLDEKQLYVNWIACALQLDVPNTSDDTAYEVQLQLPENYQLATNLPHTGHTLYARSFWELADSPLIASATLQKCVLTVQGADFYLWFMTDVALPWEQLERDFQKFIAAQIAFFGEFPAQAYHFLFQLLPYPHYHGVEHRDATVITLGPSEEIHQPTLYNTLLGISSHELFHTWNVARLRPKAFVPYNIHQACYFEEGFLLEGITTFYGDYLLYRAGVWDAALYLKAMNKVLKRHFTNDGRHRASLAESSTDLWVDGYQTGIPHRKVSIYVKGAVVALVLQLELRRRTQNRSSLDTLMRTFWNTFGKAETGYTYADFATLLVQEANAPELGELLHALVYTTAPLETYLEELLPTVGASLKKVTPESTAEAHAGVLLTAENGRLRVTQLAPNSPAAACLSLGDEWVAIDEKRVTEQNIEHLLSPAKAHVIHFFRQNILHRTTLTTTEKPTFGTYFVIETQPNTPFRL